MCGKILPFPYLGCTLVFRALALWTTCGAVPQRVHAHVPSRHRRVLLANGLLCPTRGSRVPRAVAITVFLSPTQCFAGWTGGLALSIVAQRVMVGITCPRVCVVGAARHCTRHLPHERLTSQHDLRACLCGYGDSSSWVARRRPTRSPAASRILAATFTTGTSGRTPTGACCTQAGVSRVIWRLSVYLSVGAACHHCSELCVCVLVVLCRVISVENLPLVAAVLLVNKIMGGPNVDEFAQVRRSKGGGGGGCEPHAAGM